MLCWAVLGCAGLCWAVLGCAVQDVFLRELPSVLDPGAAHFAVRARPRVQPLFAGVSYAQATPPPPSLLRAQGELMVQ
jgi:hypothetical protein